MYVDEAELTNRTIWKDKILLRKGSMSDVSDIPFSAPAIVRKLDFSEIAGNRFTGTDGQLI